jgi:hypothetical protein
MSRSLWRCRNPACPVLHGALLGRVTCDEGLVLADAVGFAVFLDTQRITVQCPMCGSARDFQGRYVRSR